MKKLLNKLTKSTLLIFLGIIIGCSLGVYAAIKYNASEINYKDKTVKEALDELYKSKESKICKRAKKLHSDGTHTFGSLGTKGTLASGDAFDCDVDGDEYHDREEERFYYVSPLYLGGNPTQESSWDKSIAVLIYYNNVSGGVANSKAFSEYHSGNINYLGPVTGMTKLPTTTQWKNVKLTNTSRTIRNELGGTTTTGGSLPGSDEEHSKFSYEGYAARLLTAQELELACSITIGEYVTGELDLCQYLLENTKLSNSDYTYGFWLETPRSLDSKYVFNARSDRRYVNYSEASATTNAYGIRPVIEVPISDLEK